MRLPRYRSLFSAVISAVLLAGLFGWAPASAAPKDQVNWSACFQDFGPFQCASVGVPLDYDNPNGAQISIAMVRLPAANPADGRSPRSSRASVFQHAANRPTQFLDC